MSTASVCSRWQERWSRATWRWPTKFHVVEYGMYCKIFGPSNRYGITNVCTHTYIHIYIYIHIQYLCICLYIHKDFKQDFKHIWKFEVESL